VADARLRDSAAGGLLSSTGPTLLVASTGGHLVELLLLRDRLRPAVDDVVWVTFDGPQARTLLAGETVVHVPYMAPRDVVALSRNCTAAWRMLRRVRPSRVVSTGSGIALAYLPLAVAMGIPTHYIESAARTSGPSLTGKLLARMPRVHRYSQTPSWASDRWRYRGSVLDGFASEMRDPPPAGVRRVVVTVGTIAPYGFRRLLRKLIEILPPDAEVLWQSGSTPVDGLGITARAMLPADELSHAMEEADVVVAHAGLGTALSAFLAGACPVLVPREQIFEEHVDDHQVSTAEDLGHRGLCVARRVAALELADLVEAAGHRVVRVARPPAFELEP
jgi:UDP-N-acetylglucosamine--N-acetylmuramyl-(pentapeptide) pyrophosphoryl-undecaprenol N-acetylglucosamine transferase